MRECCREYDYVARRAATSLSSSCGPAARRRFGQGRAAVARRRHDRPGGAGSDVCRLSIGAAHYPDDGADADRLLAEADRRMYKAKRDRKSSDTARDLTGSWDGATLQ